MKLWAAEFKYGRSSLGVDERSGRSRTAAPDHNIAKVPRMVPKVLRIKVRDISEELKIETFQQIKYLMVTEKMVKFRFHPVVRDHYLEDWLKFTIPFNLPEKPYNYVSIRESFKKKDPSKRNC
ncbi:hypothetical protein NPIL_491971 [Nephila pilipes]|uniref:Uncharacterized protein n=1 Tax=Nephila pilipes TaxID=299642 RepID=A0A8X6N8R0_NEPPI|nr:hypothetical protein NPIL_491971 [Nephila pilipes]